MNITLIQPALAVDREFGRTKIQKFFRPAPVTLPTVAGLTPPEHKITLIDDAFEDIDYDLPADLVGITGSTPFIPRVNEISKGFRKRGVKTIIGGIYGTLYPDVAAPNADSVVVGDAEDTWPRVLEDFERGRLRKFYRSSSPRLAGYPLPRREILNRSGYSIPDSFQFQRGCRWACDFCSIRYQYGASVRARPIEEVVQDLETVNKRWPPVKIFWDDNLINDLDYARKLFTAVAPFKIRWIGQSTITIANHPDILRLAAKSGCRALFFGIESISSGSLKETRKVMNKVGKYKEQISIIHDHGISVQAGIVFGFDCDDRSIFETTIEFLIASNVDSIAFSILTPYPGTPLYKRLNSQGRIIERDWAKYDSNHVVFQPKLMAPDELFEGYNWAMREFFSIKSIFKRAFKLGSLPLSIITNLAYHWAATRKFPKGYDPAAREVARAESRDVNVKSG